MKLVRRHLSASEEDVRTLPVSIEDGPAITFYSQLSALVRRPPTPPSPITIPRTLRPSNLNAIFPTTDSPSGTETDSSYHPSPPKFHPHSTFRTVPSDSQKMDIRGDDSAHDSSSQAMSIGSQDEDKLEIVAQQAITTLLHLLTRWESRYRANLDKSTRLEFRFHVFPDATNNV